ncbi:hypothetical protein ACIBCR_14910 [Micromonospora echinospora]|uniref:hypothetical protein n=1 Tax=Micromonospora echinospora TaxID=1877 RepID=UPI0037AACD87
MTDQPTLFDTLPAAPATVPHPGSACCDPTQDLAGWIQAQRARSERDWRWVTVLHQRGRRLRAIAGRAWTRSDHETGRLYDKASAYCHLRANCIAQEALIRTGDVDRIEQAHQYRLNP